MSLKYLGIPFEHYKTCEWAVKSIQALKDLHFEDDDTDYSKDLSIEQVKDYLFHKGISSNYNDPMSERQINRLNEKQARTIYNNIQATHNLVNIQQVKGKDLCIKDTDKFTYLLTYSFPCQDLSLAGVRKGMSDTSTRSGMLWEVERILTECKDLGTLPQVLLMENVPQVHGEGNVEDFNKWQLKLEELGYKNYWQDLIATDYGIPQTRNRTFMVSILGDYNYTFPKPILLKLRLKDMLENNVDEKYFLSEKMKQYIFSEDDKYKVNKKSLKLNRDIACSKTTREGNTRADTTDYICDELPENYNIKNGCKQVYDLNYYNHEQSNRVYSTEYSSPTLRTKYDEVGAIKIVNTMCDNLLKENKIKENDTLLTNFITRRIKENDIIQKNNITPTLTTSATEIGVCVETYQYAKSDKFMQGKDRLQLGKETSDTLQTSPKEGIVNSDLRIRRLTSKECFRLMGVKDEDYEKVAKNQSDSSLYHLAGDSIVVNVLMAIFGVMIDKK